MHPFRLKNSSLLAARLTLGMSLMHIAAQTADAADEPVTSIQSALKKQGFYEGEPSGRLDEPTRAALKRFQIRAGIERTGEPDRATLEALRGRGTSPAGHGMEPSIREQARDVVRSDQEFLEKVEFLNQPETSGRSEPPPPRTAPVVKPAPTVRRSSPASEASPPELVRSGPADGESALQLPLEDVHEFVGEYLRAAQGESPDREVALYAEEVDYFDSGRVSRKVVEKDQRAYYRRWPSRKFTLKGEPKIERVSDRAATVRFRMRYALRSGDESASGQTENVLRVKRTDRGIRISAIRERKVTD